MQIAGHDIHKVVVGSGRPAVMIHCALARHDPLLPLAAAIGGHVTLFDMPGHGRSADWDGQTAYQTLVAEIAAACCDGPTHLIGHSFGGTAALRLAVERPDLVSRLTLIEPVYFAAAKGTPAHRDLGVAFRPFISAMLRGKEARAAEVFNSIWGAAPWDSLPDRLRRYMTARIHLIVAGADAIEKDEDGITTPERLSRLEVPVALMRGAEAQPVIAAIHDALADRLPNATQHVIAGAGHMAPITHAAEVAALIRAADSETV